MKRVSMGILKNGLRFYTQLDDRAHVSGIGVKVGSIHDPPGLHGMAHLTEHIVAGYSKEQELKFEEYQCGPEENTNIRVDRASTFYGHDLVLRREYMLVLFDIIAQSLQKPIITEEGLEKEKAAVLNEYYLRGIDDMENLVDNLIHEIMYDKNPARHRADCHPDGLKRISIRDVRAFVQKNYPPNNMFAVVLGPSFRKTRYLVEKYFSDHPGGVTIPPTCNLSETRPILTGVKSRLIERKGIHQYHVAIGFPTAPYGSKDDEVLDVLSKIWGWRLRLALRDENREWGKGTYRALTFTPRSFAHGMIYACFATPNEEFARAGIERILTECRSLKEKWVADDELAAMSNKLYNDYVEDFTAAPGQLAERIIDAASNGDEEMRRLNSFLGRLSRVGKKSIRRVANEYFTLPNYAEIIIRPAPDSSPDFHPESIAS